MAMLKRSKLFSVTVVIFQKTGRAEAVVGINKSRAEKAWSG